MTMKKQMIYMLCLFFIGTLNCKTIFGQVQWQKSLGGSSDDSSFSIEKCSNGGYIVAGGSLSVDGDVTGNHGNRDYWIAKLDDLGIIQWQRSFGGSGDEEAHSIYQCLDKGYIVAGISNSLDGDVTGNQGNLDYWVVKLDSLGVIEWQKSLGGSDDDVAIAIQQCIDGGYIIAGYTTSINGDVIGNHSIGSDAWIVKLYPNGIIQWQKTLGGTANDAAYSIQKCTDGGYIIGGPSNSNDGDVTGGHGNFDYWIVKLDSTGTIQWQKCLGGSSDDLAFSVYQCVNGSYIVAGRSKSINGDVSGNHGNDDYWIIKLDIMGIIEWQKSFGGSNPDYAYSIEQCSDGGYIIAGMSESNDGNVVGNHGNGDYWILKIDSSGTLEWEKCLGGSGFDSALSIRESSNGSYVVIGWSNSNNSDVTGNHGGYDSWAVKLAATTGIEINIFQDISIAPNPTEGEISISLKGIIADGEMEAEVSNLWGQVILHQKMNSHQLILDISEQAEGIYFLYIKQKNGAKIVQKIQKM